MKAIMIMFDSLNRHMLPAYGCDWVKAPNFQRLQKHSVTFDRCYAGSLPCMPARRELHTGRLNFLHNSWGPLQPYDDSMPKILSQNGVYTHLSTDHYHYWEEGGTNYHTKYDSCELVRGQEGDLWKAEVKDPPEPDRIGTYMRSDEVNRKYMDEEHKQPQALTFENAKTFIETNHEQDDWFLHIETFDPHEPYYMMPSYKKMYGIDESPPRFDWPSYGKTDLCKEQVDHIRKMNAALIGMCDRYLGQILDMMDRYSLWEDTMLIVNTDHGFLLGEHECTGKVIMPFYQEVVHIPFFVWDPRLNKKDERCGHLVQTIDIPATLLDFFGLALPEHMQGRSLCQLLQNNEPIRSACLFGVHGGQVGCVDESYVYMRAAATPDNQPLYEYTLMPSRMRSSHTIEELADMTLSMPFSFTKGVRPLKIRTEKSSVKSWYTNNQYGHLLFDIKTDPMQQNPCANPLAEKRMIEKMVKIMMSNEAPPEQYERLGLTCYA